MRNNITESEAIKELKEDISLYDNEITRLDVSIGTPDRNLIDALDMAIQALEKQIPKKPYKDNENGIYEKEYCPICHRSLFPSDHHCICGQAIDWSDEESVI